jgi:hypothetical protein
MQFRLLENKLGVIQKNRVKYNAQHYLHVFQNKEEVQRLIDSETEPSLFVLIDRWLSRTPGVYENDGDVEEENEETGKETIGSPDSAIADTSCDKIRPDDSDSDAQSLGERAAVRKTFWNRYEEAVVRYLADMKAQINVEDGEEQYQAEAEFRKITLSFKTVTDEKHYAIFMEKSGKFY